MDIIKPHKGGTIKGTDIQGYMAWYDGWGPGRKGATSKIFERLIDAEIWLDRKVKSADKRAQIKSSKLGRMPNCGFFNAFYW